MVWSFNVAETLVVAGVLCSCCSALDALVTSFEAKCVARGTRRVRRGGCRKKSATSDDLNPWSVGGWIWPSGGARSTRSAQLSRPCTRSSRAEKAPACALMLSDTAL